MPPIRRSGPTRCPIAPTSPVTSRRAGMRPCRRRSGITPRAIRRALGRRSSTPRRTSTASIRRPVSRCGRSTTRACSTASTALKAGTITVAQFLDLNERIGGVDHDSNYVAKRTAGDGTAIKRAYQAGLTLSGCGGLASIPIFDNATSTEDERYHYGWFHFALRERLRQANGNADNMVMWRSVSGSSAEQMFTSWMEAYKADAVGRSAAGEGRPRQAESRRRGLLRSRDAATCSSPSRSCSAASRCRRAAALYPVYSNVRHEAGGPLAANILKCQLKPIDARDYPASMAASDLGALEGDLSGRRVRLDQAGREPGPGHALGLLRSEPEEPHRRGAAALTATIWRTP